MGESILAPPIVEDEMKGSINNNGSALEVSVSFGRFESDSLSWEKWSSFSPNKYLEEVGKCATPGSVAQKKAYFEAHYKKIAARKIEEMEQEKQKEANFSDKDDQNGEDYAEKPYKYDDQAKNFNVFQNSSNSDESNESSTITIDSQCSVIDEIVDSRSSVIDETNEELNRVEEPILIQEETKEKGIQKKAYFEAHYKKTSAPKIEEIEQEKQKEVNFPNKGDRSADDWVEKPYEYDDQAKNINNFQNSSNFDESNEIPSIIIGSQCSVINEIVDSQSSMINERNEELNKVDEPVLVQKETQVNGLQEKIELPMVIIGKHAHSNSSQPKIESKNKFEKRIGKIVEKGSKKMELGASKKSPKMAHSDREKTVPAAKKKLVPHLPKKVPEISTPKTPKPNSISSVATSSRSSTSYLSKTTPISVSSMAAPYSSTKKTNSYLPRSKNIAESKKIAPSSLHMSLSLGPANNDSPSFPANNDSPTLPANNDSPSLPTNRSSLIMEKMADKDIVKRAFKSFQKSSNQGRAFGVPNSSGQNEILTSRPDQKVSSTSTLLREYGGMNIGVGKMGVPRAQLGRSLNSTLTGATTKHFNNRSLKGVSMDQRHAKPAPSSSGLRNEQPKDISKKLVEQSSAKAVERARLGSKSKEKETEIKNLRQSLGFKAAHMPSFYRGHAASKLLE